MNIGLRTDRGSSQLRHEVDNHDDGFDREYIFGKTPKRRERPGLPGEVPADSRVPRYPGTERYLPVATLALASCAVEPIATAISIRVGRYRDPPRG